MRTLLSLLDRQWSDPDIPDLLTSVKRSLQEGYKELSTWEVYLTELQSGSLDWGVTHTDAFWRSHSKRVEDDDFSALKKLHLLLSSPHATTQAVACYDLGQFSRYYPSGRAVVKKMGGKDAMLRLCEHEDAEVQRAALAAVSKVMVVNWEHVKV